jgi:hypothetical protein
MPPPNALNAMPDNRLGGEREVDPSRGSGLRSGALVGALVAAAASVGLAWWLGGDTHGSPPIRSAAPVAVREAPRTYAPAQARAEDTRRAYDDVRRIYAEGGASELAQRSRACGDALATQPQQLDYCLAFDGFARPIVAGGDDPAAVRWFASSEARDRATSQLFLAPGQDPDQRLAQVRQLSRDVVPVVRAAPPPRLRVRATPPPGLRVRVASPPHFKARVAHAARPNPVIKTRSARACRFESTPAARALCANPSLRQADRRLATAYDQALAAGASRRRLTRHEAEWRVALNAASSNPRRVRALYETRIRELHEAARR